MSLMFTLFYASLTYRKYCTVLLICPFVKSFLLLSFLFLLRSCSLMFSYSHPCCSGSRFTGTQQLHCWWNQLGLSKKSDRSIKLVYAKIGDPKPFRAYLELWNLLKTVQLSCSKRERLLSWLIWMTYGYRFNGPYSVREQCLMFPSVLQYICNSWL